MPASTTLLQRLLAAGAALSLVAAVGANASVARALTPPMVTVLDINPTGDSYALNDHNHDGVAFNGGLLFAANDGTHGRELYTSDGTVAGTTFVKDINPTGDSSIDYIVATGNTAYFQANDGTNGLELWKSDGTEAGTVIVENINPSDDSYPEYLTTVGSTLYFAADDGSNGFELWKSDGTAAGTVMVKNINPTGSSSPRQLYAAGSTLYFTADDGTHDPELWKSDGTEAGTVMVKDILSRSVPGGGSDLRGFAQMGSDVYFTATDDTHGTELWRSDGTEAGTVMVKDINPTSDSGPGDFVSIGSTLYFSADDVTLTNGLWKSDGTEAGTVKVKDLYPSYSTALGNTLYFRANVGPNGRELYKSDGTEAGTVMVKDINPTGDSYPSFLTRHGDLLYLQASDGVNGKEMYVSDGTEAGTMRIPGPSGSGYIDCPSRRRSICPVTSAKSGVFFTHYDATAGHELGFISDPLPETNTSGNALTVALLVLSGALAAGAVIARRTEHRAN